MPEQTAEIKEAEAQTTAPSQRIKVLQIEDDSVDCEIVERLLTKCPQPVDFSVESAESLSAGVECLTKHHYDIILLDLHIRQNRQKDSIGGTDTALFIQRR